MPASVVSTSAGDACADETNERTGMDIDTQDVKQMAHDHMKDEHLRLLLAWREAGRISEDQAGLMVLEAVARLNEDPYGIEAYESPWDEYPHVQRVYLVAAYHKAREYGGPEEGGWWYDALTPLHDDYAQRFGRAFTIVGPFHAPDDGYSVAHDLNALERLGGKSWECSIEWRVQCSVPFTPNRPRWS